jgi:hypothetical protein
MLNEHSFNIQHLSFKIIKCQAIQKNKIRTTQSLLAPA